MLVAPFPAIQELLAVYLDLSGRVPPPPLDAWQGITDNHLTVDFFLGAILPEDWVNAVLRAEYLFLPWVQRDRPVRLLPTIPWQQTLTLGSK